MSDSMQMTFEDGHGRECVREVRQTLDARSFLGMPGYPWLVMAANPHLSLSDIVRFLNWQARATPGVPRTESWVRRRRWLFLPLGVDTKRGPLSRDGRDGTAAKIMAEHPKESARGLVRLLKARGITRSKNWCLKHRLDAVT